jgi:hypothetical protein
MLGNGYFSYLYLDQIYTLAETKKETRLLAYSLLGFITALGIIMQIVACLMIRRVHLSFKISLERYIDFLLTFEETPRSKFAKKYIPPMDILEEETASHYDTLRASSNIGGKFRLTTTSKNVPREHSINSKPLVIDEEEIEQIEEEEGREEMPPRFGTEERSLEEAFKGVKDQKFKYNNQINFSGSMNEFNPLLNRPESSGYK